MLLRLFAPVLAFAAEEVWSWEHDDSVHRQAWPTAAQVRSAGAGDDAQVLALAADVLAEVRKAKSTAKRSMRTPVLRAEVRADDAALALLRGVEVDLRNAGVVQELAYAPAAETSVVVELAPAEEPA